MASRVKMYFQKHRFRNRMTAINILIAIIPLLLLSVLSYSTFMRNQKQNVSEMIDVLFVQISERLDEYCENVDSISKNVFYNKILQDFLLNRPSPLIEEDPDNAYSDRIAISNYFLSFFQTNNAVKAVDLFTDAHYSSNTFVLTKDMRAYILSFDQELSETGRMFFSDAFLKPNGELEDELIAVRLIKSTQRSRYLTGIARGALVLRRLEIKKLVNDRRLAGFAEIYILDSQGRIIASSLDKEDGKLFDRELLPASSGKDYITRDRKPCMIMSNTLKISGWRLVAIVPMEKFTEQVAVLKIVWVLAPIVLLLVILATSYFNIAATRPIRRLADAFNQVASGDLHTQVSFGRRDEMTEIAEGFNQMVGEIHTLTKNILNTQRHLYEIELEKTRFELNGLQMQINAHFLYNTLNCIRGMAYSGAPDEIGVTIDLLVKYFRYNNTHGVFVSLEQELTHLDRYMRIQNIRYGNKFRLLLDVPEELTRLSVLKLTIQPLVENALIHGLEQKAGPGSIRISARKNGGVLTLRVLDNGVGMDEAQLLQLRERLSNDELSYNPADRTQRGIGIVNIQKRIHIYCGKQFGLYVKSWKNIGTVVTMTQSAQEEDEDRV